MSQLDMCLPVNIKLVSEKERKKCLKGEMCKLSSWLLTFCILPCRPVDEQQLRPITQLDLLFGLDKMQESKQATASVLPSVSEVPLD